MRSLIPGDKYDGWRPAKVTRLGGGSSKELRARMWKAMSCPKACRAASEYLSKAVGARPEGYVAGCGVDCHAMNFQPFGVFVQALRNTSLRLRGWPLISASIAARPVTSAVSPARRTLRSLQVALLYFVFPERRDASHVALVSVSPEE